MHFLAKNSTTCFGPAFFSKVDPKQNFDYFPDFEHIKND